MDIHLWDGLDHALSAAFSAVVVYVVAVVAVRLAGRRTLAQMSAFDVVVTIAIGSIVASMTLPSQASVADGVAVLLTLLFLQVVVAAARQRSPLVQRILDFAPEVVVRDGDVHVGRSPSSAQLTRAELETLLRQKGLTTTAEASVVVLEPTGRVPMLAREDDDGAANLYASVRDEAARPRGG